MKTNKIIIYTLIIIIILPEIGIAANNTDTTYYCDTFQNVTGIYCIPSDNSTKQKNNISTIMATRYNESIIFLEAGQNDTYFQNVASDMQSIENSNVQFNAQGFNQTVWAIKREAYAIDFIYSHLGKLLLYIEWLYKFDRFIYGLL